MAHSEAQRQRNTSFHDSTKAKMEAAATPGNANGNTIADEAREPRTA